MIPYLDIATFTIGGLTFHTFGLLTAIGVLTGHAVTSRRARLIGAGPAHVVDLFVVCVFASAFFFAHALDVVFYHPELLQRGLVELVMIHHGLSSFGGIFGAVLGGVAFIYAKKLNGWVYADLCTYSFPFGWTVGRAGCAVAHDHKGRLTDSWLAVRFPDGPRYDLGLMECALTPLLIALVVWVSRKTKRPGMISGAFAIGYAVIRFPLDFLRATDLGADSDPRHFGLTPGQWACFASVLLGAWMLHNARTNPPFPPEERA